MVYKALLVIAFHTFIFSHYHFVLFFSLLFLFVLRKNNLILLSQPRNAVPFLC